MKSEKQGMYMLNLVIKNKKLREKGDEKYVYGKEKSIWKGWKKGHIPYNLKIKMILA